MKQLQNKKLNLVIGIQKPKTHQKRNFMLALIISI